jgi:hypothetical protein
MLANTFRSFQKAMQERSEWQAAARALLLVVECDGDRLLAYIGMKRALNAAKRYSGALMFR